MDRFRLIDEDGVDLGPFVATRTVWEIGERIARSPAERFLIMNVVPAEPHDSFTAYLVVRRQ